MRTVGVPVTDQGAALDFYVGTLGFEKRLDADLGGGRDGDGLEIMEQA
ncbi:MAG: hypothetical protein WAK82_11310 [Streptosporangiaceae bacterium]